MMGESQDHGKGTVMTFHDFLGTPSSCLSDDYSGSTKKHQSQSSLFSEEETEIDPRSERERKSFGSSNRPFVKRIEKQSSFNDALESSRGLKLPRFESKDDKEVRHMDVFSSMQAPRSSIMQSQTLIRPTSGSNFSTSKKQDCYAITNSELSGYASMNTAQSGCGSSLAVQVGGGYPDKIFPAKGNSGDPSGLSCPPADEGSRTGMKSSGITSLINNNATEKVTQFVSQQGLSKGGSKVLPGHAAQDSCLPSSSQGASCVSRQLTIFYGGQAHVFDDIHPSKADAILALAGSNGRSWSTTYSRRTRASFQSMSGDCGVPPSDREKNETWMTGRKHSSTLDLPPDFPSQHAARFQGFHEMGQRIQFQ
eukprot:TRINITY_DN663_c0_g1_i1.p1 TRINITY_DN663_c0_g1~~TRINITY_DN663_c0_g1_i1.p1  ORF type:complete len:366 (-),score=80.22 TRINITY_DN663_c0_g1_i1:190-1287(-)